MSRDFILFPTRIYKLLILYVIQRLSYSKCDHPVILLLLTQNHSIQKNLHFLNNYFQWNKMSVICILVKMLLCCLYHWVFLFPFLTDYSGDCKLKILCFPKCGNQDLPGELINLSIFPRHLFLIWKNIPKWSNILDL